MRSLRHLIAALFLLAALPSHALASPTQESTFQDDPLLVYGTPERVNATLDTLKSFGVDRIRVSVFWDIVAPANDQLEKPNFDAADPAQYPPGAWDRYDHLIRAAQSRGILINLNITSPVPRWATTESPREDLQKNFNPNPAEFGQFVRAVGTRYSGTYAGLPRVDYWSIWNEPNQAGWLTPQWSPHPANPRQQIDAAPALYRALVANAWQGLADTGHGSDTILIGETAPQGQQSRRGLSQSIDALRFIRRLYCLDDNLNVLKGSSATLRACPGDIATFVAQNPALFNASGFAHHPYALLTAPSARSKPPDWVSMGDLRRLSSDLSRVYRRYGQKMQTARGVPLYLTEYGYQTRPDPISVSFSRQAAWINQAEYIAFKNANVRAVNQFLLVDDAPVPGVDPKKNPRLAWRTFQSGLILLAGNKRKPSYRAYITPLHVTQPRIKRGRSTGIWGMLRPATVGTRVRASLQFRAAGTKTWRTRKTVTVGGPRHYFETRMVVPRTGFVRIHWRNGARTLVSRAAPVTVVR